MKVKTKTHTKVNLTWDTRHGNSSVALIQYAKYRATKNTSNQESMPRNCKRQGR